MSAMEPENKSERDYVLIQDIAECDRPREKALRMGVHSLDNAELMAIIFGNGIRGKSVLTMSQQLLAKNKGSLYAEILTEPGNILRYVYIYLHIVEMSGPMVRFCLY